MNKQHFLQVALCVLSVTRMDASSIINFGNNVLDFENSTFTDSCYAANANDPSNNVQFRWAGIVDVDGRGLDLIAEVTGGDYYFANSANNKVNGKFGQINLDEGTTVEFTFTLVDAGTTNAVAADSWNFAFFDIDSGGSDSGLNTTESLAIVNPGEFANYTVTMNTELAITGTSVLPVFTATERGGGTDNPTDLANLTMLQEDRAILFELRDTASFSMEYAVSAGQSGRNFLFAGDVDFMTAVNTTAVAVPEPSSSSMLMLAGATLLGRRKRV